MKLARLVPIENCVINGYSLVENVFGMDIVVHDVLGDMHTTARNAGLLRQAQAVLENIHHYDIAGLAAALAQLRDAADLLDQADYERSVRREHLSARDSDDICDLAGSLA